MKPTLLSIVIVMCVVCSVSAVYKYEFSGFVYDLEDKSQNTMDISCYQEFTGWFSFSPIDGQGNGNYSQLASIFVDFGNYQMANIYNNADISVQNNSPVDQFQFNTRGDQGLYFYHFFELTFTDQTGKAFDSLAMPETLNFLDFDFVELRLAGYNRYQYDFYDQDRFDIFGVITDLQKVNASIPTPEPATIALMGLGFMALRRKK